MIDVINLNVNKKKAKIRFILELIGISLLFLLTIFIDLHLLFTSKYNSYIALEIIDIVLTFLVVGFIIFYFLNLFPISLHYFRFYKGIGNVSMERKKYLKYEKEVESKTINGVVYRCLTFSYKEGVETYYETLQLLDNPTLHFEINKIYKIQTFKNVIIRYEETNDAKD